MSTMLIRNSADVERTRNLVRRLIMGQRWSPTFCARAVAALTTLAELILKSQESGELDVSVAPQSKNRGVEFRCDIALSADEDEGEPLNDAYNQLEHIVSELQMQRQQDRIHIVARVWWNGKQF